jgi:hypothetical protein
MGWQGAGALAVLFDPATGPLQAGLQAPAALLSPSYGSTAETLEHRTYQTIQALSDRLGLAIVSAYAEGEEPQLAVAVVSQYSASKVAGAAIVDHCLPPPRDVESGVVAIHDHRAVGTRRAKCT